jgi:alpha-tubulin suppressor-like RCC1 family protein
MKQGQIMKHQLLRLALAVPLLLLCAWSRASVAQAAIADSVLTWGDNGQTPVPLAAQSGVTAIAAGGTLIVALKNDGSIVAWGNGQTTIPVAAQSAVTAIAAGWDHTVALKNDGSVVAWGYNAYGKTTVPVAAQSGVTAIAAGLNHTVALRNDGSVVAWGLDASGQTTVPLEAQSGVTAIAAGGAHTVALKKDGTVVAWGNNGDGQTTVPVTAQSGVTAIAAGGAHIVALKNDGTVVAWGSNSAGQTTVPLAAQGGVSAIAAGGEQTVALVIPTAPNITTQPVGQAVNVWQTASFTVVAAGYPLNYQWRKDGVDLTGATNASYTLASAQTNQAGSYTVVVGNHLASVMSAPPAVLTVNPVAAPGTVVAWGWNDNGQTTVPIAAQSGVTAIATGGSCGFGCRAHTVALKNDGTVVAWGWNGDGQVTGTPTTDAPHSAIASPVTLGGQVLGGVTAIAAGIHHTVALKTDGTVVAWGGNGGGQVTGTPATSDVEYSTTANPVTLGGQVLSGVTAIAAGGGHTVALKKDGSVVAWGNNDYGQTTVPLAAQTGVVAIAAGWLHTVALKNDGTILAWGSDDYDQTTIPVEAQSGVTAIAAGTRHTVALRNDGSVVAWGYNSYGLTQTTVPVAAQSGVTAIAAGDSHTVALKNDGSVVAWGLNGSGQVSGTPTTDAPYFAIASPVTLEGQVLSGVTAIAAVQSQTVALIGGMKLLPSLNARPNGNELIFSWPTNAPGFTLQSTLDLTPPVTWLDSTGVPTVIGAHFTLTNTTSGGNHFFRLRKM